MHTSFTIKTLYVVLCGTAISPVLQILERYFFNDWQFLFFLLVLVGVDTTSGFVKHWKNETVSSLGFAKLFWKLIVYALFLITTHVLTNFTVDGGDAGHVIFEWVDTIVYAALLVRESISICENLAHISPGLIPQWILKRLQQFDETGNPKP